MIIIDTREQLPLFNTEQTIKQKLEVGDYTTEKLINKIHIERKSPQDLYQSIIQNHNRFRTEILRAKENNILLEIFVECTEKQFYGKQWDKTFRLKVKGNILAKIITTIQKKYDIKIEWNENRQEMERKIKERLENG
jgi:ERCC4-type nuclease